MMTIQDINRAVLALHKDKVPKLVQGELDQGTDISTILNQGLISAMDEVGRRFSEGNLFMPEMLAAGQAMKAGLEVLEPLLSATESKPKGTVVIGTVKGDLHDIGKNLVAMMLNGAGFKVVDLGVDVGVARFMDAVKENEADILGLSALLTTTMPAMEQVVFSFKKHGPRVKIIIGGAPVTEAFAVKIGADGYGEDAPDAVKLIRNLLVN
jgi:5-methyltetrahydrofolate--homocysteine methyltransferase